MNRREFFKSAAAFAAVGAQGLELCVFRRDSDRKDHTATHLDIVVVRGVDAPTKAVFTTTEKTHVKLFLSFPSA